MIAHSPTFPFSRNGLRLVTVALGLMAALSATFACSSLHRGRTQDGIGVLMLAAGFVMAAEAAVHVMLKTRHSIVRCGRKVRMAALACVVTNVAGLSGIVAVEIVTNEIHAPGFLGVVMFSLGLVYGVASYADVRHDA